MFIAWPHICSRNTLIALWSQFSGQRERRTFRDRFLSEVNLVAVVFLPQCRTHTDLDLASWLFPRPHSPAAGVSGSAPAGAFLHAAGEESPVV